MDDSARAFVIEKAVNIERSLSMILGAFLDIDISNSKTLGNKPSALAFKQKVDILSDVKFIEKDSSKKLQFFAEIRNQFAHNYECKTFLACFQIMEESTKNGIIKIYSSQVNLNDELSLKATFVKLTGDVEIILVTLIDKLKEKWKKNAELFQYRTYIDLLTSNFLSNAKLGEPFKSVVMEIFKTTDNQLNSIIKTKVSDLDFPEVNEFSKFLFKDKNGI